ncbi:MAG: PAS domain-containing protein, partial [Desulfovibrionaceae bacterium]|nr:PAS domain-containing protein [Desulfovibrionaceae bacterium]
MNKPHETGKSREELEAELEAMRRRLAFCESVLEDLPVPVFVKDEDSRFCLFNRAYETFFGARREEMLGRTVLDLEFLSPEERERYQAEDTARIGAVNEK